ncbi:hypothetical protein [Liquorilactobacillus sicerae]|uniref:hypothetical protein n=1 Tax=Liquorilactobacillus sicerae TaxID=1416943 RepID=UPI00247FCCB7|nr:hypothetical protein [Liquorilactobacillus sicerae]
MNYKYYEEKLRDIKIKAPIEAGVEVLAFNVLDNIIDSENLSLVVINSINKNRNAKLTTDAGISDLAVVSKDFSFKPAKGEVYGFVEVKFIDKKYDEKQIVGQMSYVKHLLYTDGLIWKYFEKVDNKVTCKWKIYLLKYSNKLTISQNSFNDLLENLRNIDWGK